MIKFLIIGTYVAHKVYWKRTNRMNTIEWKKFFPKEV
jgi:hypothetical protein